MSFCSRTLRLVGIGLSLAYAFPVAAQVKRGEDVRSGGIPPQSDIRPTGIAQGRYRSRVDIGILPPQPRLCDRTGCLHIINATTNYDIIGIYFDVAEPGEPTSWSRNQLTDQFRGSRLTPGQHAQTNRTGDASTCAVPTRFLLRKRRSGERIEAITTLRLCRSPEEAPEDAFYRVRVEE